MSNILSLFQNPPRHRKQIAVLIDPDKQTEQELHAFARQLAKASVDFVFVGGSLLTADRMQSGVQTLKSMLDIPVVIFPGNEIQIAPNADALLFLSLISGRNPEMLIGKHVVSAPILKQSNLEVIPTGYILIDGGKPTSVVYMSNTVPIPYDKNDIAACTALAGEMLGLRLIYLEAGSGALCHVSSSMIHAVKQQISVPLIVGGGIRDVESAYTVCEAGADMVVIGTALEKDASKLQEFCQAVHRF